MTAPGRVHRCAAAQRPSRRRWPGEHRCRHRLRNRPGVDRARGTDRGGRRSPTRPRPVQVETEALAAYDVVHPALGRPLVDLPIPAGRAPGWTPSRSTRCQPGTIAAAVAQNAAGIVLSATGSGNTHPDITAQVSLAVQQGVTVVVSTRVPYGEVAARYGGGGGAVDLVAAGALVSAWLRAPQARMALIALLTAGATRDDVASFLASSGPG